MVREFLHDPVNHLGLAWQPEQREEEAERLVEDEPRKVEQPQEGIEGADGMLVAPPEVLADLDLAQALSGEEPASELFRGVRPRAPPDILGVALGRVRVRVRVRVRARARARARARVGVLARQGFRDLGLGFRD